MIKNIYGINLYKKNTETKEKTTSILEENIMKFLGVIFSK